MTKVEEMLLAIMVLVIINGLSQVYIFRSSMDIASEYLEGQIRLDELQTNKLKSIEHKLDSLIESSAK